jgi:tRNA(Arg) A34 adenosine deaminase TadA
METLAKIAEDLDKNINRSGARLASAIIYKNQIISYGVNQNKSHPFHSQFSESDDAIYLHAETDAIKNALKRIPESELEKASLYVCRVKYDSNGRGKKITWGLAKPCIGCQRAIATFGIRNVIYSNEGIGNFQAL